MCTSLIHRAKKSINDDLKNKTKAINGNHSIENMHYASTKITQAYNIVSKILEYSPQGKYLNSNQRLSMPTTSISIYSYLQISNKLVNSSQKTRNFLPWAKGVNTPDIPTSTYLRTLYELTDENLQNVFPIPTTAIYVQRKG